MMSKFVWQNGTLTQNARVNVDGTYYDVEPEQYTGDTPLSAENLNEMVNGIFDEIYYKKGDTFSRSAATQTFHVNGLITSGTKSIRFDIYLPKKVDKISTITMTKGNFIGRSTNGTYINGSSAGFYLSDSGISATIYKREGNRISVVITSTNEFTGVSNNTPVSLELRDYEFNFS